MAKRVPALEHNAELLRELRSQLGWSTTVAAARAREKAREFGDNLKLPQQLVSKFENGGMKSTPRWIGYMQLAMADEVQRRDLPDGRIWMFRFPPELQTYFAEIFAAKNRAAFPRDEVVDAQCLDDDEIEIVSLVRRLNASQREMLARMIRSVIVQADEKVGPLMPSKAENVKTLHTPSRQYEPTR